MVAVGIYCLVDGAAGLVGALRHPELREYLAQALIVLGIGAVLVFWPETTVRTLRFKRLEGRLETLGNKAN